MSERKVYDVGPYSLEGYELERIPADRPWVVVWYEVDGYEGSGLAATMRPDGNIEYKDLGHCSCYGAIDGPWESECSVVPKDVFLTLDKYDDALPGRERSPRDYSYSRWQPVVAKVRELVLGA